MRWMSLDGEVKIASEFMELCICAALHSIYLRNTFDRTHTEVTMIRRKDPITFYWNSLGSQMKRAIINQRARRHRERMTFRLASDYCH